MRMKSAGITTALSGVTIGGSGGGRSLALPVLTVIVVAMALVTVWQNVTGGGRQPVDTRADVPFKCTDCGAVIWKTPAEYDEFTKHVPKNPPPPMPPKFLCPKCGKETLMQAVQCPKCDTVFIIIRGRGVQFDDTCPNCGLKFTTASIELREAAEKRRKKK